MKKTAKKSNKNKKANARMKKFVKKTGKSVKKTKLTKPVKQVKKTKTISLASNSRKSISPKSISSKSNLLKPKEYNHSQIEKKWQNIWEKNKTFIAKEKPGMKKFYGLIEFPYPSGEGLHVGHIRSNTAMDIIARKRRREGFNVLYPIGYDAFGLPTENYAIKTGIQPAIVTKTNTDIFRKQLKSLGFSFDWSREITTSDPKYYKWTQWIFLQLFKKGLAYKKKMSINWCPKDLIGLANEEVIDGKCERCGTPVEKREMEQWMLAITKYAERLDKDLDDTDYLEKIKIQQRNWIGKSEGALIKFGVIENGVKSIGSGAKEIEVFTTRPDTLFGVTYVVLAPEHRFVNEFLNSISNRSEVEAYIQKTKNETEIQRTDDTKEKTGVELKGIRAINPVNKEEVLVFIADYVLADYGTGAVMAVPAHDERDWAFAKKFDLPIKEVILKTSPVNNDSNSANANSEIIDKAYINAGILINSENFNGKNSETIGNEITNFAGGTWVTKFKLRDWIFSRQHYWGEPIPLVNCAKCGIVSIPEKDLPVVLPKVKNYKPTSTGESPLAAISKWVNTKCPVCKGPAKRETDTMPNWAGSSWYYLRYADAKNAKNFADPKNLKYWTPVDWYNGGMEHTTLHLLYSRFWHKFLFDQGLVPTNEPYQKRTSHGLILAAGGEKMSKSRGNVVNPDDVVKSVGADTLRIYEMFMGPFDQPIIWDTKNIAGSRRFIERVWKLKEKISKQNTENTTEIDRSINKTVKKVSDDIESMRFNTAISSLMILVNEMEKSADISKEQFEILLKLLAPFAPHFTEELWSQIGNKKSIHITSWPEYDATIAASLETTIIVQVNGKIRASFTAPTDSNKETLEKRSQEIPEIRKWIDGKAIIKIIVVPNRLVNIVIPQ